MNSLYGNYRQKKFSDVWEDADSFALDFGDTPFSKPFLVQVLDGRVPDPDFVNLVYYLLYARYGNDIIASSDINRFKYDLFSIIFSQGLSFRKRLEIQESVRSLTVGDITEGAEAINNFSTNPSTTPATDAYTPLATVNNQTATKYKKSILDGYTQLYGLIESDLTEEFMSYFKRLFLTVVQPELPLWYVSDVEEDEEDE